MMFYRYISENMTNYVNKGEIEAGNPDFNYEDMTDEDAQEARAGLIDEKGYFILSSELFSNVRKKANADKQWTQEHLNEFIEQVFKHIEESSKGHISEHDFVGLLDDFDVNSNKLGATVAKQNDKLTKLLNGVGEMKLGDYKNNTIDAFGDAYEYLMTMYASNAGKSGGEFYTPQEVSELLTRIAVVGKHEANKVYDPACGKTSILRLISRLYDYDDGSILIDGKDIKKISTDSLFGKISIVFQDVTLFNTSILENIRLGKETATDEEVKEAAKLANCMDFIDKLPEKFDAMIGENGAELSGGERQRLSIARAFLKDAPILILDEISASLDVDNEKKIQDSLNKLIKDKTVIVISHRLKSIENVDKIVVIDDGYVEMIGNHEKLIKSSDVYKNLIQKTKLAEQFNY